MYDIISEAHVTNYICFLKICKAHSATVTRTLPPVAAGDLVEYNHILILLKLCSNVVLVLLLYDLVQSVEVWLRETY